MAKTDKFLENREWYISSYDKFLGDLNGEAGTFYDEKRNEAVKKLGSLEFPTQKVEDWKYTSVAPLMKYNFVPATGKLEVPSEEEINAALFFSSDCYRMVFSNGRLVKELSSLDNLPSGVIISGLAEAIKNNPELVGKYIGKSFKDDTAFSALNSVYNTDGIFIYVPDGKMPGKPLQVLFLSGDENENILSSPRNLFIAGENASFSVIMRFGGRGKKEYFTNVVNEVFAGKNGVIDLYKVQDEQNDSYHIDRTEISQDETSVVSHYSMSFGGRLVRNDINAEHHGERLETNLYGLYLANDEQHVDNHTFIDHVKPNCESNELYKGILDDKARGVFNGKILVRKDSQKTNAYQSNKTVLLSDNARIDTKPQLEIYADDVKCSHGATIGYLDEGAYFYIRSRGVPAELANSMLIRAFADDVVQKVKIELLREQLNHMIFEHLNRVEI